MGVFYIIFHSDNFTTNSKLDAKSYIERIFLDIIKTSQRLAFRKFGPGGIRTHDQRIMSPLPLT